MLPGLSCSSVVLARCVRCSPLLFGLGVLSQYGALLAIGVRVAPVIPHTLLLIDMALLAVGGIRCRRVAWQAVDACLLPERDHG